MILYSLWWCVIAVFHGKTGSGYLTQFYPPVGPVTYLGITQDRDGHFKFVVAEGENQEGLIFTFVDTNMRTKFSISAREFVNRWSGAGPRHHMAAAQADTLTRSSKSQRSSMYRSTSSQDNVSDYTRRKTYESIHDRRHRTAGQ